MMDVIITGASRGIGFETAFIMATSVKCRVLAVSRNCESLLLLKKRIDEHANGSELVPFSVDFEKPGFELELINKIESLGFKPQIVINNAGLLVSKPFEDLSGLDFDRMFDVNVKSVFLIVRSLIKYFPKNAHIVNISSIGGVQGSVKFSGLSLYSASKAAVCILTECLAEELKPHDIQVNCLALGAVQTEMLSEAFPNYKAKLSANEMGKYIVDFAINGNKYFNGKVLPVSVSTP
jgi:NAD(P)-dependent dehydrogenase (short-subunit alcohol dehydrogenase family)